MLKIMSGCQVFRKCLILCDKTYSFNINSLLKSVMVI